MSEQSKLPAHFDQLEHGLDRTSGHRLKTTPNPVSKLWSADDCPEEFLNVLAVALSVDVWDENWPTEAKRNVLREAPRIHRHKGTLGAVRLLLKTVGYGDAEIVEGLGGGLYDGSFNYDGSRFYSDREHWVYCRVYLNRPISIRQAAQVRRLFLVTAPRRCILLGLHFEQALNLYDGAIKYDGEFTYGVA